MKLLFLFLSLSLSLITHGHAKAQDGFELCDFPYQYKFSSCTTQDIENLIYAAENEKRPAYIEKRIELGHAYYYGDGVEKDYEKAHYWYVMARQEGTFFKGLMIVEGKAEQQEGGFSGMDWINEARTTESVNALGDFEFYGQHGIEQSYKGALGMYTSSAHMGSEIGICKAAYMIEHGLGTKKNLTKAYGWYNTAAGGGYDHTDDAWRARVAAKAEELKKQLTPKQIACTKDLLSYVRRYQEPDPYCDKLVGWDDDE